MQKEIIEGFRLSPQQEHLWLLQQVDQSRAYRVQCAILLEGNLNKEALKTSLQNVVNRHEILRSNFNCLPGMTIPLQVIAHHNISWNHDHDLSAWDFKEQEAKFNELFNNALELPFDFKSSPLLHISLVTLSPDKHILLVSLSALCGDLATLKNLVREISDSYAKYLHNEEVFAETVQYADISEIFNTLIESEDTKIGREYWCKKDISHLLSLELPYENRLSEKSVFEPQSIALAIPDDTLQKIKELARKYETSISSLFLTALLILLWRLIRQPDIIVGSAYDGRTYEGLEGALGLFAKYLPIQCHLEQYCQFCDILAQVNKFSNEVYEWQEYFSWTKLLESRENEIHLPFFSFCFEFQELPARNKVTDLSWSIYKQYTCIDRFKVKLSCVSKLNSIITEFHYDCNLFQAEDIKRLAEQFHSLLESITNNPEALISELNILSHFEQQRLLLEFNNTKINLSSEKCIHQLFQEQAECTPDKIAVMFENQQLTYAELNIRANQLAHYLQTLGVGPDVRVGICVQRSLEMILGILGILKAGGAFVPLDPKYPKERLIFVLEDAQTPVLLTQAQLLKALPELEASIVCLDTDWETIAKEKQENPSSGVIADNLSYLIYTSGSTGRPKGVMIEHRGLCNHLLWAQKTHPLTEADQILQIASFSFDFSVWEFFGPLLAGARLLIVPPEGHQDLAYLVKLISEQKVTVVHFVPSMLQAFLDEQGLDKCRSLRLVLCGGEALPTKLQDQLLDSLDVTLYNQYGPTEATIDASFWVCKRGTGQPIVPIGRPIANTNIYLLDSHLQPVPIGLSGELHISGIALARGYLNQPGLTAEKFIPNPFSDEPDSRLYKTGDLARYLEDGNLEFLGRLDHQVKIRGFRIELREIEAVLSEHSAIRETVVLNQEDTSGKLGLVAYVVPNPGETPTTGELRNFSFKKLPNYMLPSVFVVLDALPLTPNGKIDRHALLSLARAKPHLDTTFVAPRTTTEEILGQIWAEVLGLEKVGIYDDFFELGGDSLLGIKISSRLRKAFELEVPVISIFESPTVAELAVIVEEMLMEKIEGLTEDEAERLALKE